MARRLTFALHPRWLALHALVAAACVTMVLLGRWQWQVAQHRHGAVQNYSYALQWWAFTVFALVMWVHVLRDARRADEPQPVGVGDNPLPAGVGDKPRPADGAAEPVAYRRYVMPQSTSSGTRSMDPELAAYNDYLRALSDADEARP
ncbi:MAG: hypothetical protein ABJB98_12010 [Actinomycetota bacterium]